MKIRLLEQGDEAGWDQYLGGHKGATLYHHIGWKHVIEDTYGHRPYYLMAEGDDGRICGVLPMFLVRSVSFKKRLISVPFAPYGGVCGDDAGVQDALVREAIKLGQKSGVSYCEFRDRDMRNMYGGCRPTAYYVTDIVDLSPGMDTVWNAINKNVKRKINKGKKSGLSFNINEGRDAVLGFYDLYAVTMSRLGTPVHKASFFENIRKHFPHTVFIANVEFEGKVISSLYLLKYGNTMIYGWGASLPEYLKLSPNAYNYWCSMNFACRQGLTRFDFGRSLIDSGNYHFKEGWGAAEIPIIHHYYPPANAAAPPQSEYQKFAALWSRLPIMMARAIGPELRKYVP